MDGKSKTTDEVSLIKAYLVGIRMTSLLTKTEGGNWNLLKILLSSFSLRAQHRSQALCRVDEEVTSRALESSDKNRLVSSSLDLTSSLDIVKVWASPIE